MNLSRPQLQSATSYSSICICHITGTSQWCLSDIRQRALGKAMFSHIRVPCNVPEKKSIGTRFSRFLYTKDLANPRCRIATYSRGKIRPGPGGYRKLRRLSEVSLGLSGQPASSHQRTQPRILMLTCGFSNQWGGGTQTRSRPRITTPTVT